MSDMAREKEQQSSESKAWDPVEKTYTPLQQGELDESYAAIKAKLKAERLQEMNRSKSYYPLWSIPTAGFFTAAAACFVLAFIFARLNTSEHVQYWNPSVDCNRIQASGLSSFYTHASFLFHINTSEYWNAKGPSFEEAFLLDIKTAPVLSFVEVKMLDVLWNLVAGQGLRFLMGYLMYIVSYKALILSMEEARVSYNFYVAIAFQCSSASALVTTLRELAFSPRLRTPKSWIVMAWMVMGMVYALAIPSLLTATTGYTLPSQAVWQMPDGAMVQTLSDHIHACFLVQDGYRIGLPNDTFVSGPSWLPYFTKIHNETQNGTCQDASPEFPLFNSLSNYICEIGDAQTAIWRNPTAPVEASTNTTIKINGTVITLPNPALNIGLPGSWVASEDGIRKCFNNQELSQNFTPPMYCVTPSTELYSVGFSKNLSFGILMAQGFWCITTWAVWYYVTNASRTLTQGSRDGPFRSAYILTTAMDSEFGSELEEFSEEKMRNELAKREGIGLSWTQSGTKGGVVGLRQRDIPA